MAVSIMSTLKGIPEYDDAALYLRLGDRTLPWEFDGWKAESLSWKTGCYIHAGLSGWQVDFEGPEACEFFASICVNSFVKFPVGNMKHVVMCTREGLIAGHAVLQRNSENAFRLFAAGLPWAEFHAAQSMFRVETRRYEGFLHQVAGPTSLETLERAAGESLRDIAFMRSRGATINGIAVQIARMGMSGTLAYEVRGPLEQGPLVYDAIYRAGQELGIQRLGWRTYLVNHVEGGFPQTGWTFFSAAIADEGFRQFAGRKLRVTGSVEPANMRARFRTPVEVGWVHSVRLDHDFLGRAALEREIANPKRTVATLRWNAEDVVDIYASHLRPGEEYKSIDMPTTPSWHGGFFAHADHILRDGKEIGFSSGTIYSYHFREVLSMATLDIDCSKPGTEVIVHWGDHGRRIKQVRATVERYPYLSEGRNDQIDTAKVPAINRP